MGRSKLDIHRNTNKKHGRDARDAVGGPDKLEIKGNHRLGPLLADANGETESLKGLNWAKGVRRRNETVRRASTYRMALAW